MRQGRILVSKQFFLDMFKLPGDWQIETMSCERGSHNITVVMSGADFPEETGIECAEIKNCELRIHKEQIRFEVVEID